MASSSTQNTAPVIRFQCLFTNDIKRKAKRWQDGFLKFHTFNKRVMVYDTPGNLVGDLHRRECETVEDGDEFELDRGILVQVGEKLETTVTDLTALLEKRNQPDTGNSPRKSASSRQSPKREDPTASYPSSGRLKSLNEVLGIKKSVLGKTLLPTLRSPYEERQAIQTLENNTAKRPVKKRKISTERHAELDLTTKEIPAVEECSTKPSTTSAGSSKPTKKLSTRKPVNYQPGQSQNTSAVTAVNVSFQPASTMELDPAPRRTKDRPPKSKGQNSGSQQSLFSMFHGDKPVTTLKLAPEKPRNKLMFMDLHSNRGVTRTADQTRIPQCDTDTNPSVLDGCQPEITGKAEASESVLTPKDVNVNLDRRIAPVSTEQYKATSSLQVPTSIFQFFKPAILKPHQGASCQDDETCVENGAPKSADGGQPQKYLQKSTGSFNLIATDPKKDSDEANPQETVQRRNTDLQKPLLEPSAPRQTRATGPRVVQTKLFSKKIVHEISDEEEEEEEVETGAWTTEALDLFDWWPPGRPKPGDTAVS